MLVKFSRNGISLSVKLADIMEITQIADVLESVKYFYTLLNKIDWSNLENFTINDKTYDFVPGPNREVFYDNREYLAKEKSRYFSYEIEIENHVKLEERNEAGSYLSVFPKMKNFSLHFGEHSIQVTEKPQIVKKSYEGFIFLLITFLAYIQRRFKKQNVVETPKIVAEWFCQKDSEILELWKQIRTYGFEPNPNKTVSFGNFVFKSNDFEAISRQNKEGNFIFKGVSDDNNFEYQIKYEQGSWSRVYGIWYDEVKMTVQFVAKEKPTDTNNGKGLTKGTLKELRLVTA